LEPSDTITHKDWGSTVDSDCEDGSEPPGAVETFVGFLTACNEVSFRLVDGLCLVKADGGCTPDSFDAPSFCIRHFLFLFCDVERVSLSKEID